jgi:maltose/moltooligosaccharide transporter
MSKTLTLPDLPKRTIWNMSFGFFGVQIVYTLQTSSLSRIFATIGADPNNLSLFWLLPPLIGMIVQPIVGKYSDKIYSKKFGRRKPFLLIGGAIAVLIMLLLPNAGSFNFTVANALIFGTICIALLDMSSNMAMQPFKMLPGDLVNNKQKTFAYSVQSFLVNVSAVIAYLFPYLFTLMGIKNTAEPGVVPDSVKFSFYFGFVILVLCIIQSVVTIKEMPPKEYAKYHDQTEVNEKKSYIYYIKTAPSAFWTVGLVQFFCWGAFLILWTYGTGAISANVFDATDPNSANYQHAGNWYGVASAVMSLGAVAWALFIPKFSHRVSYIASLLIGAAGFASVCFISNQYILLAGFALIGFGWAAMMSLPFSIVTNSLKGRGAVGMYLGLFNCSICLPQIVMAILGKGFMHLFGGHQPYMFLVAAVMMILGAVSVLLINEK